MAAHRAYRVLKTSAEGCFSISELHFRNTPGGANLDAAGAAIQSSCYSSDCGSYGAYKAFSNTGIFHDNCTGAGSWLGWDYGASSGDWQEVNYVAMRRRGAYPEQGPSAFTLQYTDDDPAGSPTWHSISAATADWYSSGDALVEFEMVPLEPLNNPTLCDFTGEIETYTVPAGVTSVTCRLWGAGGHGGQYGGGNKGGGGGFIEATFDVDPGDVLGVQVGEGGSNAGNVSPYLSRGRGGWPDGGHGSRGDTWGGGGGGSSRIWRNGVLMAVAGGGGAAAGYSGNGGGGGGQAGADSTSAPVADPGGRPGHDGVPYGWKTGRSIADVGPVGRTGGHGGYMLDGTGDDGGGGGGGYYGGGGSGGDGRSGGGGLSWTHADCTDVANIWGNNAGAAGGTGYPEYTGTVGVGVSSNLSTPANNGYVAFGFDNSAEATPGGTFGPTVWKYIFDRPADTYIGDWNVAGKTIRFGFNADALCDTAESFRINIRGAGVGTFIEKMFVGWGADPTNATPQSGVAFASAPTQIFFNGGDPDVDIGTDEIVSSDLIEMPIEDITYPDGGRLVFSIFFKNVESDFFIGGSGGGYDFVEGDFGGGRNGSYRLVRCAGDVSEDLTIAGQEEWQNWQFLESIQGLGSAGGGGPDPEPTGGRRRQLIVVC